MREIFPGLWHWTTFHQNIRTEVSSHYVEPAGLLVDPMLPEAGVDAFADRERPRRVVLTSGNHTRDARSFADAYGIPIVTSREGAERIGGALEVETHGDGDELAPGVQAVRLDVLSPDEYALHITVTEPAISLCDGLHNYGGLGFFGDEHLGDDPEQVKAGLRQQFRTLLERDFDHLLFAHGDPIVGRGKRALEEFLAGQPG